MPATFPERLDELLGLASYAGRCASAVATAERMHYGARHGQKAEPARDLRAARRTLAAAEAQLVKARRRFCRDFAPDPHTAVAGDDSGDATTRELGASSSSASADRE